MPTRPLHSTAPGPRCGLVELDENGEFVSFVDNRLGRHLDTENRNLCDDLAEFLGPPAP